MWISGLLVPRAKEPARAHKHRTVRSGRALTNAELTVRRRIGNPLEYFAGQGLIFRPFISKVSELVFYFVPILRQEFRLCKKLRPIISGASFGTGFARKSRHQNSRLPMARRRIGLAIFRLVAAVASRSGKRASDIDTVRPDILAENGAHERTGKLTPE